MNSKTLRALIELGETDKVEFKRKFSGFEKIAKEMIAFANTRGGHLLIGIDDDGSIIGVASEKAEIDLVYTAAEHYCEPLIEIDIDIVPVDGEDVIAVYIPESRTKPHRLVVDGTPAANGLNGSSTSVYIRQGDRSVLASKEVARVMAGTHTDEPLRLEIGNVERALFDHLEKNGRVTLREFRHIVNISERRASRSLVRLVRAGLLRLFTDEGEDYYTLA
jgi:predicted HTH transcriptional regulator